MAEPQRHFDGGTRVAHVVFAEHKTFQLGPVLDVEFRGFDYALGGRHRLFVAGKIVGIRLEMVGVVVFERCYDKHGGAVEREGAVRLVRLYDELAGAYARHGEIARFAADAPRWVVAKRAKELCDESRGCCLAVRAAHRYAVGCVEQLGKHLATVFDLMPRVDAGAVVRVSLCERLRGDEF